MAKSGRNSIAAATAGQRTTAMLDQQVGWEKLQVSKFDDVPQFDMKEYGTMMF